MCVGGYLFITSVVGLSGADFAPRCLCGVDAHRHMLLVAALAQLAVFLALSLSPGADGDALAGLDVTGAEAKLARAVRAHRPLARGVSLAVFALQLADLALASALLAWQGFASTMRRMRALVLQWRHRQIMAVFCDWYLVVSTQASGLSSLVVVFRSVLHRLRVITDSRASLGAA